MAGASETHTITKYLAFQVFTAAPNPHVPVGGSGKSPLPPSPSNAAIKSFVDDIIKRIGITGNTATRLAFIEGPISFDQSDAQVVAMISDAFAVARQKDLAVGFHIDDSMFWSARGDLLDNQANIECIDWNKTPCTGRRLDWGPQPTEIAPQMCFNSPQIRSEVARRASKVIGPAMAKEIEELKREGRSDLFAGVIVGWETQLGRDFATGKETGYRSLMNRGYSARKLPKDLDQERDAIVSEFIENWCQGFAACGLPKEKIFSHVAVIPLRATEGATSGQSYSALSNFAPPTVAFGSNHLPGFSTYPQPYMMEQIYEEVAAHGNTHWASSEGTNVTPGNQAGTSGMSMETYLAQMFNYGASLVNVFGWGVGGAEQHVPFRTVTEEPGAIQAYRKFLHGQQLVEGPQHFLQAELPNKIHRIQALLPNYMQTHADPRVPPLMEQLDHSLKTGNLGAADGIANQILDLVGR